MSLASLPSPVSILPPVRRRPKATRPTSRPEEPRPRKVSVYLSEAAIKRLDIHVAMDGGDRSRLVEQLIQEGLRRYDMPRKRSEATLPTGESAEAGPDR